MIGEGQTVDQDANSDVARALAAFGAPEMAYRSFSHETLPVADPAQTPTRSVEFPLLLAALPEIEQCSIPQASAPQALPHEVQPPKAPELVKTEVAKIELQAPASEPNRNNSRGDVSQKTESARPAPRPVSSLAATTLAQRRPVPHALKQQAVVPSSGSPPRPRTTLGTVFRSLRAASPTQERRTAAQSGLQDMFNLL